MQPTDPLLNFCSPLAAAPTSAVGVHVTPVDDMRHLPGRVGLGVTQADWNTINKPSYEQAADRLLTDVKGATVTPTLMTCGSW